MNLIAKISMSGRTVDGNVIVEISIARKRIIHFTLTPEQLGNMLCSSTVANINISDNHLKLIE